MSKVFSFEDVASHNKANDLWMIVDGKVYDITKFISDHPGGEEVLLELAGLDGTEAFEDIGHSESARKMLDDYLVGSVDPNSKVNKKPMFEALPTPASQSGDSNSLLKILIPLGLLVGYVYYKYT